MPGKAYLHVRVRSARDLALAAKLDLEAGPDNVVPLFAERLTLDAAWPGYTFEKIDAKRASLIIGMFIDGSLTAETDAVITRIEEAGLFQKLVDYVIAQAGPDYRIARAVTAAKWLSEQAQPTLDHLKKGSEHNKIVLAAQKEFEEKFGGQLEVAGPHLQQFATMYQKHHDAQDVPE